MTNLKIFDRVWVMLGGIQFPASVWGIDKRPIMNSDGSVNDYLVDILIVINGIAFPRTVFLSSLVDAREDCAFSFSTKDQLQSLSEGSQRPSDESFELL